MSGFLRQATASQSRSLGPFVDETDFKTAETALTINNTDIKLSVNGAASANKNSGGGTHRVNGHYGVTFDATDTATVGELNVSVLVGGALQVFDKFTVVEEAVYDAFYAASAPGYVTDQPVNVTKVGGTTQTAGDIMADTNDIQARLPAALVSGRMDASVGAVAANAITAASIATDAIDSDAIAASAVTELQAGLATAAAVATVQADTTAIKAKTDNLPSDPADASDIAGSFTTVNTKLDTIATYVDTEVAAIKAKTDNLPASPAAVGSAMTLTSTERDAVADALLDRNMATGTDSGSPTVRTVRQALRFLRNKWSIAGGTLTVRKEDDATASWTGTATQTAGNPVSEIDPV